MASLKDIKHRIAAVKNIQKVTRAMKLVAAAKLKRAQKSVAERRLYANTLFDTAVRVSRRLGKRAPRLWSRSDQLNHVDLLLISSDRGLCGGFNENLIRAIADGIEDHLSHNISVKIYVIGKKGLSHAMRIHDDVEEVPREGGMAATVDWVVQRMIDRFKSGESAGSNVVFNRFISASRQKITFWNLLPLHYRGDPKERNLEYLYEPDRDEALERLCLASVKGSINQAIVESNASELAARMSAMDAATNNADDMIAHLTGLYNRRRQETITSELMDIVNGAEALR